METWLHLQVRGPEHAAPFCCSGNQDQVQIKLDSFRSGRDVGPETFQQLHLRKHSHLDQSLLWGYEVHIY